MTNIEDDQQTTEAAKINVPLAAETELIPTIPSTDTKEGALRVLEATLIKKDGLTIEEYSSPASTPESLVNALGKKYTQVEIFITNKDGKKFNLRDLLELPKNWNFALDRRGSWAPTIFPNEKMIIIPEIVYMNRKKTNFYGLSIPDTTYDQRKIEELQRLSQEHGGPVTDDENERGYWFNFFETENAFLVLLHEVGHAHDQLKGNLDMVKITETKQALNSGETVDPTDYKKYAYQPEIRAWREAMRLYRKLKSKGLDLDPTLTEERLKICIRNAIHTYRK